MKRLITAIFILCSVLAGAETKENQVIIQKITINGTPLETKHYSNIVIAQSDSIEFFYYVNIASSTKKSPFLFKFDINSGEFNHSYSPSRDQSKWLSKLPEDNYEVNISALSPESQWVVKNAKVKFKVNNREAALLKKIDKLEEELANTEEIEKKYAPKYNLFHILGGLLIGTIIAFLISWIIFKNKKDVPKIKYDNKKVNKMADNAGNDEQYKVLATENGNLRAEIAALRGQIDALQKRGDDLRKQNRDLQEKIDMLSKSKTEIEELQKQKDELFSLIIHDIKNPVALIKNLVELLRSYDLTATEQHEIIDDIFTTTTRIVSLSQEVSKIISLECNTLALNSEACNMNMIVSDVARRYEKAAKEKDIMIQFKPNDSIPDCEIDHLKIDDVLDNLISNAIKFSYPGGKVLLSVKQTGKEIVVDVSDKGQGLSEEDIQKAFKRGAMLSARPTGNEHSSGLGLWIVKRLIEVHGGRVWIKSAVGKGSTFSFSVPVK